MSILCSISLLLGSNYLYKGLNTLDEITNTKEEITTYSLIVMKESPYQNAEDLKNQKIGFHSYLNYNKAIDILDEMMDGINFDKEFYDDLEKLQNELYENKVQSIILLESFRGMMEDIDQGFSDKTRIIDQYEIKEDLPENDKEVKVSKDSFNIYISGIDTYGPLSSVSRSDVNMIVTVNPNTKTILMTSIPRDYYVPLATFGIKDKLTHAGLYGINESIHTLENLFDIEINYYARVNFSSLVTMVDALGGVDIYVDEAFTGYHTFEYYPIGNMHMNGEKALEFVRERYGLQGGDRARIKNQQKLLKAMLKKAMSPAIITNYSTILNSISSCFQTNMESTDITDFIQMQLNDMQEWNFEQIQVDGSGKMSSTCYSLPNMNLYVMEPDMNTVYLASNRIKETIN